LVSTRATKSQQDVRRFHALDVHERLRNVLRTPHGSELRDATLTGVAKN
jgi:hypothetical protein